MQSPTVAGVGCGPLTRSWNLPPPPETLGGQAKPVVESLPAMSCQQPLR